MNNINKTLALIALMLPSIFVSSCKSRHSQVLVIGTIHQRHQINKNYSYAHILQILNTFDPDIICVEIRPEEFREKLYLKEMVLATIWGMENGKSVYPIDWWTEGNHREERKKYMKTSEYAEKNSVLETLFDKSKIIPTFKRNFGEWEEFSRTQDYSFFNGKEYNSFKNEAYRISHEVYGDHCMNGYWQTRNLNMFSRIKTAIEENQGKKIIILTGADHKYFFDRELEKLLATDVVDFADILPLAPFTYSDEMMIYYAKGLINHYFDFSSIGDIESVFRPLLTPFVHGPGMDFNPETIPEINIDAAKIILDKWQEKQPDSILLEYEIGWYYFLTFDNARALQYYKLVIPRIDNIDSEFYRNFVKGSIYRNMGFCYDLLGEREKAVKAYIFGEQILEKLGKPESYKKALYRNFKHKPFQWPEKDN